MKNSKNISMSNSTQSITRIKAVYNALDDLQDKVVFVGGAVVALYANRVVLDPRPTDDIDLIVEVLNYRDHAALEEKLHQKGFVNDQESGIACRYRVQGITVDIMPTTDRSFGFDSMWYESGFKKAIPITIDNKHTILILSAPYYIATKLEAFRDRGHGDGRTSQDFEDIVFILNNRSSIWSEIDQADEQVRNYIFSEFSQLLSEPNLFEWVFSHADRSNQMATSSIIMSLEALVGKSAVGK